jgi:hypothetical protein
MKRNAIVTAEGDFDLDAQQAQTFSRRWANILQSAPKLSFQRLNRDIDEYEQWVIDSTRTKFFLNERLVGVVRLRSEIGFFKGASIEVLAGLHRERSKLGYINALDEAEEAAMYARMCLERGALRRGAAVLSPWIRKMANREVLLPWAVARNIRDTHAQCTSPPNKALQRTSPPDRRAGKAKSTARRPRR